jgi:ATP-dependent Clp protease ATP-binding subunit ClpA
LSHENVERIFDNMIADLKKRLSKKSIGLEITPAAKKQLIAQGYDPKNGARPLRRTIEDNVETLLADNILAGKFDKGDIAKVDYKKGEFTVVKARE